MERKLEFIFQCIKHENDLDSAIDGLCFPCCPSLLSDTDFGCDRGLEHFFIE